MQIAVAYAWQCILRVVLNVPIYSTELEFVSTLPRQFCAKHMILSFVRLRVFFCCLRIIRETRKPIEFHVCTLHSLIPSAMQIRRHTPNYIALSPSMPVLQYVFSYIRETSVEDQLPLHELCVYLIANQLISDHYVGVPITPQYCEWGKKCDRPARPLGCFTFSSALHSSHSEPHACTRTSSHYSPHATIFLHPR